LRTGAYKGGYFERSRRPDDAERGATIAPAPVFKVRRHIGNGNQEVIGTNNGPQLLNDVFRFHSASSIRKYFGQSEDYQCPKKRRDEGSKFFRYW
jgi:hypothetical protein